MSSTADTPAALAVTPDVVTNVKQSDKIVVHWLENSRAQRVVWLLEELGLQYEVKPYKRINMVAPPELKEVHPLGKSPVVAITSSTGETTTLAESGYIFEHLISHYESPSNKLAPISPKNYERYKYLLHYAEGTLMPPLLIEFILSNIKNASVPFFIKPITNAIVNRVHENFLNKTHKSNFDFLENMLKEGNWFCGEEFSGAFVMLGFPLDAASGRVAGFGKEKYPKIHEWLERIKESEGYKRATEKVGGPEVAGSLKSTGAIAKKQNNRKSMI